MVELLASPDAWISLAVLTAMEIVLGIDNIVFITILCGRLPQNQQLRARRLGIGVALVSRLILLSGIAWVIRLTEPLFHLVRDWSGKDLILLGGGLFLLWKATHEIYSNVEHPEGENHPATHPAAPEPQPTAKLSGILGQIILVDVVFSLDSVITAVGMANHIAIMVTAVLVSVGVMLAFAGPIGDFVQQHASVRILALAFLVLIGSMLIMEGTGQHVAKGYIYFAMGFSLLIEMLNLRRRRRAVAAAARAGAGAD
ncbi:MAG: TerC family protein [Myxococcota bacterium]